MSRVLNLGSGNSYVEGETNIDFYATKVDVRHDLNVLPYPFPDNSFDQIRCMNILEHLENPVAVMRELHRIGSNGCTVAIRVPHFRSASVAEDITHRRGFAWRTFDMFTAQSDLYGEYMPEKFEIVSRQFTPYLVPFLYRILSRAPMLTDHLLSKFIPMASISFLLRVHKPG